MPAGTMAGARAKGGAAVGITLVICGVAYLLLARFALCAFPVSGDEHSYLVQGQIFSHGHLSVPTPANGHLFEVDHVVLDDRIRTRYPPGWPALLALGFLVGAPWIVAPLCGVVALALVYATARRLEASEPALVAVLLLGLSPFFALNAASFQSHVPALVFEAAYAYALLRAAEPSSTGAGRPGRGCFRWAFLAGLALGALSFVRPGDAFLCGLALAVFLRRPLLVVMAGAGALPFVGLTLVYNAVQFGSPWLARYHAYQPKALELFGKGGQWPMSLRYLTPVDQWDHVTWFLDLSAWLVPGTLVLAVAGLALSAEGDVRRQIVRVLAVAPCLMVPFLIPATGDGYGPRYLFLLMVPIGLATARASVRVRAWLEEHPSLAAWPAARRTILFRGALGILLVVGILRTVAFTESSHVKILDRSLLYRRVADMGLDHAVVIVKARSPTYYARNLSVFDGPVLYVSALGVSDEAVRALYPDRTVVSARQEKDEKDWTIAPVR
jgi:hypothetical protein